MKIYGVPPRPMIKLLNNTKLIGAEIGVYRGEHAKSILKNCDIEKLYLIDPFDNYEFYTDNYGPEQRLDDVFTSTQHHLSKFRTKIQFIRKFSSDAINDVPNNLDFVYIDGNHDYRYVKNDLEMYWHKIKQGGIIGGHDISNGGCVEHNGIITAVCEFAARHNLQIFIQEPDWWLLKDEGLDS